ncbi:MAG: hypothetical protein ABIO45_07375, partial [Burkholderiaceae bacterium]
MTFPLASLHADGGTAPALSATKASRREARRPLSGSPPVRSTLRAQSRLLVGGVLWLLAVLALVTHQAGDAAFSTTGASAAV